MKFAPILVSVYNRKDHLIRLIDSLRKNSESIYTDLFIVSDAAHDMSNEIIVTEIRKYIAEIRGFNKVELICWSNNKGSHNSILDAINHVFKKYNMLIFLEDDNFVADNFLAYLNEGLSFYKNNSSVFSITGYNYLIDIENPSSGRSYFFTGFSAWGVGIWKNKWKKVDMRPDFILIKSEIKDNKTLIKGKIGERVYTSIYKMCKRRTVYVDVMICYHCYKNNLVSIFPEISKVRNYGHDGLGEHGGNSNVFVSQRIDSNNKSFYFESKINTNHKIMISLLNYFSTPMYIKITTILKLIYIKVTVLLFKKNR